MKSNSTTDIRLFDGISHVNKSSSKSSKRIRLALEIANERNYKRTVTMNQLGNKYIKKKQDFRK